MDDNQKIYIKLQIEGKEFTVGELVLNKQRIFFRYDDQFIRSGFSLSPVNLKFNTDIQSAKYEPFEGLFGLFNDSLPDAWGRLLLDRILRSNEVNISNITPLDRLSFIGKTGMGALVYEPENLFLKEISNEIQLDKLAEETKNIIEGSSSELLEELMLIAGSSGGARPKIFVGYHPEKEQLIHSNQDLAEGYEHWLIKFPASIDHLEIAKIEYAYYKMALVAGIEMSESRLFESKSGQYFFGTKRFDRIGNQRLHLHSASGLLHDNFNHSLMDYGHLMDLAFKLEKHIKAYEKVFRLAAFNVFTHNRDDHSKNFSFLMDKKGKWKFAPAYDLTYSSSSYGFHSTMIAGESQNPTSNHLLKLADHFGVKDGGKIIEEVKTSVDSWKKISRDLDMNRNTIQSIDNDISKLLSN